MPKNQKLVKVNKKKKLNNLVTKIVTKIPLLIKKLKRHKLTNALYRVIFIVLVFEVNLYSAV